MCTHSNQRHIPYQNSIEFMSKLVFDFTENIYM